MVDDAVCVMLAFAPSGLVWTGLDDHTICVEDALVDSDGLFLLTSVRRPGGVSALIARGAHMEVAPRRVTGLLGANAHTTGRTSTAGASAFDEGSLSRGAEDGPKKDQAQECDSRSHCSRFEKRPRWRPQLDRVLNEEVETTIVRFRSRGCLDTVAAWKTARSGGHL